MTDQAAFQADLPGAEAALRRELARGDAVGAAALPVLRHLVAAEETALLSEEVLARVRGMLADVASQVLDGLIGDTDRGMHAPDDVGLLTRTFLQDERLLQHVHALALEWQLTETLQESTALDPVSPPLLQRLLQDEQLGEPARRFLKSQAQWCQAQRRMALPLAELPLNVLQSAIESLRKLVGADAALSARVSDVEARVRRIRTEVPGRLDLALFLCDGLERRDQVLSVCEAGLALFCSGLSRFSDQPRDVLVLSMHPGRSTRLALALLAAGASHRMVETQLLVLTPRAQLPTGLDGIDAGRAAALLTAGVR